MNCINDVWPEAIVKLDPFHWLARWDEIIMNKNSLEAAKFRSMMSRAILVAAEDEFQREK